jgi:ABC-type transporter Mla MlaB component
MLRITVHDNLDSLTFQIEGRLAGAWVREVEECRQRTLAGRRWPVVHFDLTGVTFIDAAGKAYLAAMHRQGAEFIAADCLTKAIVAEIAKAPPNLDPSPLVGQGQGRGRSAKAKARRN